MNVRNQIKSLLALKCITIKQLATLMSEATGQKYTQQSISHKLSRQSLTLKEASIIAEILGYQINFIEK